MGVTANRTRRKDEPKTGMEIRDVRIPPVGLAGTLRYPPNARAIIAFAHGSGSSRFSPRNRAVAEGLNAKGFGTLLFDLLTLEEEGDRANVFDVALLAARLVDAVRWLDREFQAGRPALGLFGASTGAAAALVAAVRLEGRIGAVVSPGGRPPPCGRAVGSGLTPAPPHVGRGGCGRTAL